MRKAGLLNKKPLTATRTMLDMAKNDRGVEREARTMFCAYRYTEYGTRFYFRASVSARGILEVDLYTRKDLAAGMRGPRFRIFLDREKKDFESWDTVEEKWSTAKIDMLETGDDRYRYSYRGRNHATAATLNTVNGYLGTGCQKDVETAVLDFQAGIRACRLSEKHRRVTDAIDGYMDMVPDRLPADWMKFINDRVLAHSVFYTADTGTGYCTHCRLRVPLPEGVGHKTQGMCRQCGAGVTYRSWKMQKHTTYRTTAALLQKCTDGVHYAYRQFRVDMYTERQEYYEPEIKIYEDYRVLFLLGGGHGMAGSMRSYEWGHFMNTGIDRWCNGGTVNHGGYNGANHGYARSVLYTGNIRRLLKGTPLEYVPVAVIVRRMGGERINVMEMINDMEAVFPYEAFWKMGLRRFVQERVRRECRKGLASVMHREGARPWEILGMAREDMKQAARLDATDRQVRIIQKAAGAGVRLTDGQVEWIDGHIGVHEILDYLGVQTPHSIIRYLGERTDGRRDTLDFWTDYLGMARQMGWNLHDRSVFFPQDIGRAHDEAAAAFTIWKDGEDAEKMRARDEIMRRNAEGIRKAFHYSDDRYIIRVPECFLDFKHEGNAQHSCVATYYDRAVEARCIILFIRKRQDPEKPFCTVEVRDIAGRLAIVQNRTAYNRDAPGDAAAFMEKAISEAQKVLDGRKTRQRAAV